MPRLTFGWAGWRSIRIQSKPEDRSPWLPHTGFPAQCRSRRPMFRIKNTKLLVDRKAPKELESPELLEHTFPLQVPCEVNGSALAVVELQLDQVATPIDSRNNVVQHSAIPSGEACRSVPHPRASVVDHHSRCGLSEWSLESLSTVGSTSRFGSSSSPGRPQIGRPLSSEVAQYSRCGGRRETAPTGGGAHLQVIEGWANMQVKDAIQYFEIGSARLGPSLMSYEEIYLLGPYRRVRGSNHPSQPVSLSQATREHSPA